MSSVPDLTNEPARRVSRGSIMTLVILVVIAVAGVSYDRYQTNKNQQAIYDSVIALTRGQFDVANNTIAKVSGGLGAYEAQVIAESSKLLSSSPATQLEGVRLIKSNFISLEKQPLLQADTIGRLFEYLKGFSNDLFAEVFTGPPFESYYVPNDRPTTLKNLAEHSLTLKQTSAALFQVGVWHAAKILKNYDKKTILSEKELVAEVTVIQDILKEADALYPTEKSGLINPAFSLLYDSQFFYNRGYLYGILALVNETNLKDAEYSFGQVHRLYEAQVNAEGVGPALLESRLPYADLDLALFQNAVGGSKHKESIEKTLSGMVAFVEKSPSPHTNFFLSYLTSVDSSKYSGVWLNWDRVHALAMKYPDFKKFLIKNGWVF